jgi:hypothetical protein
MVSKLKQTLLCVLRTSLVVIACLPLGVQAQTVVAPDQCSPTPSFPVGTLGTMCPEGKVLRALYSEDFDSGFGSFIEDAAPGGTNDLTLSIGGDTPSDDTGPETTAACSGSSNVGEFVFLEGSSALRDEAHCMSSTIDLTNADGPLMFSFWYYMFGSNVGELNVKVNRLFQFSLRDEQQTANGQAWQQGTIDLTSHAGDVVDVQICMLESNGFDSQLTSDISLDQVEVYGCEEPGGTSDILDYLPAILANVERRPPPPPPPARWRVTNRVHCPSFFSEWTVSDGTNSRSSLVRGQVIFDPNTSPYATVEPGNRTFSWRLKTQMGFTTCGAFSNSFTRNLKPGYDYEFILKPNGGGFSIDTKETKN